MVYGNKGFDGNKKNGKEFFGSKVEEWKENEAVLRKSEEDFEKKFMHIDSRKKEILQCVVWLKVENSVMLKVLVDTGAQLSMTSMRVINKLESLVGNLEDLSRDVDLASGVSGNNIRVEKCKNLRIKLGKKIYNLKAHAVEGLDNYDIIMGLDFLVENELDIFPSQAMLKTREGEIIKLHMKRKTCFNYAVSRVREIDEEVRLQSPMELKSGAAKIVKVLRNGRRVKPALEQFWKKKGIRVFCQQHKLEVDAVYIHITNASNRHFTIPKDVRIALIFGVSHLSWQSWYQQVRGENLKEAMTMSKANEMGEKYVRSKLRHHELLRRRSEGDHCQYKNDLGEYFKSAPYYDPETRQNMINGISFTEIKTNQSRSIDANVYERLDSSRIFACERQSPEMGVEKIENKKRICQTFVASVVQPWLKDGISEVMIAEAKIPMEPERVKSVEILNANYENKLQEESSIGDAAGDVGKAMVSIAIEKSFSKLKNGLPELGDKSKEVNELGMDTELKIVAILGMKIENSNKANCTIYEFKVKWQNGQEKWINYNFLNCDELVKGFLDHMNLPAPINENRRVNVEEVFDRGKESNTSLISCVEADQVENEGALGAHALTKLNRWLEKVKWKLKVRLRRNQN